MKSLRVDGGPTKNTYLMQFQSDISDCAVMAVESEELSGIGAVYLAGIKLGLYNEDDVFSSLKYTQFTPHDERRTE